MKRIISKILILCMVVLLCACGKEEGYVSSNGKGTRDNPYQLGDKIEFKAQLSRYEDYGEPSGIGLDVAITFNESYYDNDVENLFLENDIILSGLEPKQLLNFTVTVDGDYDESIYAEDLFFVSGLTEDLKEDEVGGTLLDDELEGITDIYTGVDYSLYRELGDSGDEDIYKYATITFEDMNNEQHTIWIDITQ